LARLTDSKTNVCLQYNNLNAHPGLKKNGFFAHGSILGGSLKRSAPPEPAEGLGMAKLAKRCNHPQILRI